MSIRLKWIFVGAFLVVFLGVLAAIIRLYLTPSAHSSGVAAASIGAVRTAAAFLETDPRTEIQG
jgi:hypothetical protein